MYVKPTTLIDCYEETKRLSALQGFSIFTPSPVYFRAKYQFVAASNDTKAKGVFRIWIHKNSLWIEFLPFYEARSHQKFLEARLEIKIKQRKHRPAMRRFNPIHKMVIASQYKEFDMLAPDIRLP